MTLIISIVLIAGGISGALYFLKNQPQAQRRRPMSSMVPVVETMKMPVADQPLRVECLGTVVADTSARIQAQVSGQIVSVNPLLVEGELVKKGDILVQIDDSNYRIALAKAEANLLTAQTKYRIEEGQQDVVRQELELMGAGDESDIHLDLTLRVPQLKAAEAAVQSAELAVEDAQLDLQRTTVRAPFDAVVVSRSANTGDYAQPSRVLVELAAINRYFIRASVPLSALVPLPNLGKSPYPATITLSDGSIREARTHKLLPDLTDRGRMARILLVVDDPYKSGIQRPLLLNEYVRVSISGEIAPRSSLIPRRLVRDGDVVWMMDREKRLRILPAEVLQGYEDEVLIRVNSGPGLEMVTTDLTTAVDGMEIRRVGDAAPQRPGGQSGRGQGSGPDGARNQGGGRPKDGGPDQGQRPGPDSGDQPAKRKPGA